MIAARAYPVTMLASPYDRLDPIAALVRWWTTSLSPRERVARLQSQAVVASGEIQARGVADISLDDETCFVADLVLPKGSPKAHRQAIWLQLADLAPIDPSRLSVTARAISADRDGICYRIAMTRRSDLLELERMASKRGISALKFRPAMDTALTLSPPRRAGRQRILLGIDLGMVLLLLVAASLTANLWSWRLTRDVADLQIEERALRRSVIVARAVEEEAEISRAFVEQGVIGRRPGVALRALYSLNAATPDNAWWTSVRWTPSESTLTLESNDPSAVMTALSNDALAWRIELSGAIGAPDPAGTRTFDLRASPVKASPAKASPAKASADETR